MTLEELKKRYGNEYPEAVVRCGIRMVFKSEGRFSRRYHSGESNMTTYVSRFMDGSATITASELQQEWTGWNECDQVEFCNHSHCLSGQVDYPEMLRFIMGNGCSRDWSSLAISIARHLPQEEAFAFLVRVLRDEHGLPTANVSKAISMTKHPEAGSVLRGHLAVLWIHPDLWKDDPFVNWICFDAATCIGHLVELGAPAGDFVDQVRRLSQHVCPRNRDSCRFFLSKHYPWLSESEGGL